MAIACLPQRDEVLDGRVIDVMATGITVQSGPIKTFISLKVRNLLPTQLLSSNHLLLSLSTEGPLRLRLRDTVKHMGSA